MNADGGSAGEREAGSDATTADATGSDATTADATGSDATTADATGSDATTADATGSDATTADATGSDDTGDGAGESGYVHDPAAFEEGDGEADPPADTPAAPADREFGTRGWVLVAAVLVSFFVIPAVIVVRPPALPFEVALLVFPLLPAVILGAVAVWAMAGRDR